MTRTLLSFAIATLLAAPVWAQQATPDATAAPADDSATDDPMLDVVISTGTRRQDRTVKESMSAIDVIQSDALQNAGNTELQAVLSRTVPSFNFPRTSITDASDHVRPAQLRGLAPDQTLVLINGKRRHRTAIINVNGTVGRGSSPVDLNAIPSAAIERIEVLRDGASAQYGSDAIAGVINVVLKDQREGGAIDLRVGQYDEGDGDLFQTSANVGLGLGENGYANFTVEYRDKAATNRAAPDRRQQYPLVNGAPDPREASFDRLNHRFGDADTQDRSLTFNSEVPFTEGSQFYAFGTLNDRDGNSAGFFRRALDARNVPAIYPDGFLPLILSDVQDRAGVAGVRGEWENGWAYDLSINAGNSRFAFTIDNSLNNSVGATSQTRFYAGRLESGQTAANFDLNRGFDVGFLASTLNVATGLEYRDERFEISPGEASSYFGTGSQVFPGFRPGDSGKRSRSSWSAYLDLEGDVNDQLTLGAAARYEDYSDFGNETSGKLSARFALTERYALRATYATGFRAPNLQQQYYSTTATNFINGQPFDIRTFAVTDPVAQALGAEPLKAETSESYTLGFVGEPIDGWSLTLDLYKIKIEDRINLSENLTGTAVRNFLAARGFPGTDGGRYFTNALDTDTEGLDFITSYDFDLADAGTLTATLAYNYSDTDITRIAPNPPELSSGGLNLLRIGRVEAGRLQAATPQDKIILGTDWAIGDFTTRITSTRYGKYKLLATNPLQDEVFDPEWVFDVSVSYQWNAATFTLGLENATDNYPEKLRQDLRVDANGFVSSGPLDNSFAGILPYARGEAPFGFNGRFYYAKLNYQW